MDILVEFSFLVRASKKKKKKEQMLPNISIYLGTYGIEYCSNGRKLLVAQQGVDNIDPAVSLLGSPVHQRL